MRDILLRRVRLNVRSSRFWAGFVGLLLLSMLALVVQIDEHSARRELFRAERDAGGSTAGVVTYSQTRAVLHRPPSPLAALVRGLGERYGSTAVLAGAYAPPTLQSRSQQNFLFPALGRIDFDYVLLLVASLLAVFVTADVVAGERRFGTLQLTLAHDVARWRVIAGEYAGSFASLILPLAVVGLASLLLLVVHRIFEPSVDLLVRLGLIGAVHLLVVSIFLLLGLLASTLAREPATSLVIGFFFWIVLIALFPAVTSWMVRHGSPIDDVVVMRARTVLNTEAGAARGIKTVAEQRRVETFRAQNLSQASLLERIWRTTPFTGALLTNRDLAGTGLHAHRHFLSQVQASDRSLREWQRLKLLHYPEREWRYDVAQGELDLSGLPSATYRQTLTSEVVRHAAAGILLLVLWNLLAFGSLMVVFSRYDVRAG